ncbi:MAG TPA: hypothetical protein VE152_03070, partial [Acidimicrobiales bacterium]|nr:hypothetical protein [Acidimicrobiales bacterium]
MRRKRWLRLSVLPALALMLAACGGGAASSASGGSQSGGNGGSGSGGGSGGSGTLTIAVQPDLGYAPLYIVKQEGWLKQ